MNILEKIDKLLIDTKRTVGVDPSAHAFTRHTGQMKKNKPAVMKGSPSDEKKRIKELETLMKKWDKEEKNKKYGYTRKNR